MATITIRIVAIYEQHIRPLPESEQLYLIELIARQLAWQPLLQYDSSVVYSKGWTLNSGSGDMAEVEPAVPGWRMPVDDLFTGNP